MGRPPRNLDPAQGPVQAFAAELRKLREEAGNPKYLQMQRLSGRSRTALSEAAGGDHLATWETVEAYVRACGADPHAWEDRWERVRDATRPGAAEPGRTGGSATTAQPVPVPSRPAPQSEPAGFRLAGLSPWTRLGLAAFGIAALAALGSYVAAGLGSAPHAAHQMAARVSGPRTIIVQNMVASGPSSLFEDDTPAYLSSQPVPYCAERHCEIAGTQMWSGTPLQATCWIKGEPMTNENTTSPGIGSNKNGVFSDLWYRCVLPDGRYGYISEVYIAPADRGGLSLPTCVVA